MSEHHTKRGFFGALCFMIFFGGSAGIFHKANFILECCGGNVYLGVVALAIGGVTAIFGCLALNQLVKRTEHGGLLTVLSEFVSGGTASGYGWFSSLVAMPAVIAVLAWVCGIYTLNIFGAEATGIAPVLIGLGYVTLMTALNLVSYNAALKSQRITTVLKFLPLVLLGVWGIAKGDVNVVPALYDLPAETSGESSMGWLYALSPVAFCFENWFVTTTYAKHSGNKKTELNITLSLLVLTALYVLFYLGVSAYGESILAYENNYLWAIISHTFSSKVVSVLVMLTALFALIGTVDTLTMGEIRYFDILADGGMMPKFLGKNVGKKQAPVNSIVAGYLVIVFWLCIHSLTEKAEVFTHGAIPTDFAEIAMIINFALLVVPYVSLIKGYFCGKYQNAFLCVVCPIVATAGTALFLVAGIVDNPLSFAICAIVFALVFAAGTIFYDVRKFKGNVKEEPSMEEKADKYLE